MFKLNSKRGEIVEVVLMPAMIMLLAFAVFLVMFNWVGKIGETTTFQKEFLAKDIALLIDSLYTVPGQAVVYYSKKTFNFTIEISENKVEVYENKSDFFKKSFYFTEDPSIPIDYKVIGPSEEPLVFSKRERKMVEYLEYIS